MPQRLDSSGSGVDLIIIDIPEGLSVPVVSPHSTPEWNAIDEKDIELAFHVANFYFAHKNTAILIFHSVDPKMEDNVFGCAGIDDWVDLGDWWGLNELSLTHPTRPASLVHSIST